MTNGSDLTTQGPRHAYDDLLDRCRALDPFATSVVFPCEATALADAVEAAHGRLITPTLVGPRRMIAQVAQQAGLNITSFEIDDVPDAHTAAAKAVEDVKAGRTEVLMKGSLHTDELMAAVVAPGTGLRTS